MSERDSSYRKPVCLIHGIESDGAWRDLVREVLEPHFRCVPLDHDHFARLGWAKIFLPWLRKRSVQHVFRQFSDEISAGSAHLIAHSFGTWISSRLMAKTNLVRFDRVIFAGSPLPVTFNWERMLKRNPGAFTDLRNEIGDKDLVVSLAGKMGRFFGFVGAAGRKGFRESDHLIHSLGQDLLSVCRRCLELRDRSLSPARIHNVNWSYAHSEWFVAKGHAANFWLPYLWGIEPAEYISFVDCCLRLKEEENGKRWGVVEKLEDQFRDTVWSWTGGLPMAEFVLQEVSAFYRLQDRTAPTDLDLARDRAVRLVWVVVAQAVAERHRTEGPRRENILLRLQPSVAIGAAVEQAVLGA